jgi:hypothetical protein
MAFQIPMLILYLTGIIIAIVTRKRIGKAAIFAIAAFLLLMLSSAITIFQQVWYLFWFIPSQGDYKMLSTIYVVEGIVRTLIEIIAYIFLFVAIFAKRNDSNLSEPPLPYQNLS